MSIASREFEGEKSQKDYEDTSEVGEEFEGGREREREKKGERGRGKEGGYCIAQCSHCSTLQYSTVQFSSVQHSTVQYSTVQYSTVQYSTVLYSTAQCSTVQSIGMV